MPDAASRGDGAARPIGRRRSSTDQGERTHPRPACCRPGSAGRTQRLLRRSIQKLRFAGGSGWLRLPEALKLRRSRQPRRPTPPRLHAAGPRLQSWTQHMLRRSIQELRSGRRFAQWLRLPEALKLRRSRRPRRPTPPRLHAAGPRPQSWTQRLLRRSIQELWTSWGPTGWWCLD